MNVGTLYTIGLALIFSGILIVILALLFFPSTPRRKERIRGAGVIVVGPVRIVIGTDNESAKTVLLLSIVLTVLAIVAMVVYWLMTK